MHAMVKLPPPVWVLIFLLVAGAISALMPWRAMVDLRLVPLGPILAVLGLVMPVWAFALFKREGTEINPVSEANKALVTYGPFALTRNPMYLGLVIVSLGIAFWVGALPMFAVPVLAFAVANWVHIPFEEAKMRRQFGAAFDAYSRKVRRWV
jgi:protein-S-isoprenylcysteine O-methyltransferase Ste14